MAGRRDVEAGSAYVRLYMKQTAFDRGMRTLSRQLKSIGKSFTAVGRTAAIAGGAMVAAFTVAIRTFAAFDDQMRAVQAVTGATGVEFAKLTKLAKELGRTTSFTASQVAEGMLNLSKAGFSTQETEDSIAGVMNLARATGTDLAEATQIAGGALRAFEMDATEMGRVVDVLTATANNSAQTLTDLGESMKFAAPIAAEYGMTIEQTSKALGVMANMQIKGSMAGTGIRKMMGQLASPAVQEQLRGMGVEALDASGELKPLGDIMVEVGKAMDGMTGAERLTLAKALFGDRAFGGALKLTKGGFDDLADAIDNAGGVAEETAKTMDKGIGGALRRFKSAFEGIQNAIGDAVAGSLSMWADKLSSVAGKITEFISTHQKLIVGIGVAAVAIAGFGGALIASGAAMSALGVVVGALNPVVLGIGVAVAAAGAAWALWGEEIKTVLWPELVKLKNIFVTDVLPALKDLGAAIVDDLLPALKNLAPAIKTVVGALAKMQSIQISASMKLFALWAEGVAISLRAAVEAMQRMGVIDKSGPVVPASPGNTGAAGSANIPRLGRPPGGGGGGKGGGGFDPAGLGAMHLVNLPNQTRSAGNAVPVDLWEQFENPIAKSTSGIGPSGTFSTSAALAMSGGVIGPEERNAKANEQAVVVLKTIQDATERTVTFLKNVFAFK